MSITSVAARFSWISLARTKQGGRRYLVQAAGAIQVSSVQVYNNGNWWIEQEHFAADFAADIPKEKAELMAVSQVPISTDAFTHQVKSPAWMTKPTWYMWQPKTGRSIQIRSA